MRIAIVGSRAYPDLHRVRRYVLRLATRSDWQHITVVSGGARGVDTAAIEAASCTPMQSEVFKADWNQYGRSAGVIRNQAMIDTVDQLVAFWDGKSKGTQHAIDYARKRGIPVTVFDRDGMKLV